jgi:hypothetical protein
VGNVTLSFTQLIVLALAPATVAGLVGVASGVVGPWWLQRQKDQSERKRRRAEKFEELVAAVFEHGHWLNAYQREQLFGDGQDVGMSPIAKVLTIPAVYFPGLNQTIAELDVAATEYELWIVKERRKKLANEPYAENLKEGFASYLRKRTSLLAELRNFARRELRKSAAASTLPIASYVPAPSPPSLAVAASRCCWIRSSRSCCSSFCNLL